MNSAGQVHLQNAMATEGQRTGKQQLHLIELDARINLLTNSLSQALESHQYLTTSLSSFMSCTKESCSSLVFPLGKTSDIIGNKAKNPCHLMLWGVVLKGKLLDYREQGEQFAAAYLTQEKRSMAEYAFQFHTLVARNIWRLH